MLSEAAMRLYLERHLAPFGRVPADLHAEIDHSLGRVLLAVAAGSVLHGLGNSTSDVDIHVVVENPKVTDLPIPSRALGLSVDVNYVQAAAVKAAAATLDDGGRPRTHAEWKETGRRLQQLNRLLAGLPLTGDDDWLAWRAALAGPTEDHARRWWIADSLRYRVAAEVFAKDHPLLAAQRYCDAGLTALDALATAAGEGYFGPKWVGTKLARLERADLLDAYYRLIDVPVVAAEAPAYLAEAADLVGELLAPWSLPTDPTVMLSHAPGAAVWHAHDDRALLHRWGLGSLECPPGLVNAVADPAWSVTGKLSELDGDQLTLVRANLVWLCVQGVAR